MWESARSASNMKWNKLWFWLYGIVMRKSFVVFSALKMSFWYWLPDAMSPSMAFVLNNMNFFILKFQALENDPLQLTIFD